MATEEKKDAEERRVSGDDSEDESEVWEQFDKSIIIQWNDVANDRRHICLIMH